MSLISENEPVARIHFYENREEWMKEQKLTTQMKLHLSYQAGKRIESREAELN